MTNPMARVKALKEKSTEELVDIYLLDGDDRTTHAALRLLRAALTVEQIDDLIHDKTRPVFG